MFGKFIPPFLRPGHHQARRLRKADPWFYAHYIYAANTVVSRLRKHLDLSKSRLVDFGCGDGIMALGVSRNANTTVTGLDVTEAFSGLPNAAAKAIDLNELPKNLDFIQVDAKKPLPFADAYFDGGYSWSVFEHVDAIDEALAEIYRVLKPNAVFFLQIEPLFLSPFGSHLKRLIDEPWAHLLTDEVVYLQRAKMAKDHVHETEKDLMYRENEFDNVKNYLLDEYRKLNRVTANALITHILKAGFHILDLHTKQAKQFDVPLELLSKHAGYDLRTKEIQILMYK